MANLDDDCVAEILARVPMLERRTVCPRVCRQWHRVLRQSNPRIWGDLRIPFTAPVDGVAGRVLNSEALLAWLDLPDPGGIPRSSCVRALELLHSDKARTRCSEDDGFWDVFKPLHDFGQRGFQAIFDRTTALRALTIKDCSGVMTPSSIVQLGALTQLTHLEFAGPAYPPGLNGALQRLTALEHLVLCAADADGSGDAMYNDLPEFPPAILGLTRLTHLSLLGHIEVSAIPDGITELIHLRELTLEDTGIEALPAAMPPSLERLQLGLSTCFGLASRQLEPWQSTPEALRTISDLAKAEAEPLPALLLSAADVLECTWPHPFPQLRHLRALSLAHCGLVRVPAALLHCVHLETLDLCDNQLGCPGLGLCALSAASAAALTAQMMAEHAEGGGGDGDEAARDQDAGEVVPWGEHLSTCIPWARGCFPRLRHLDLSDNQLPALPGFVVRVVERSAGGGHAAERLCVDLSYNCLQDVPVEWVGEGEAAVASLLASDRDAVHVGHAVLLVRGNTPPM